MRVDADSTSGVARRGPKGSHDWIFLELLGLRFTLTIEFLKDNISRRMPLFVFLSEVKSLVPKASRFVNRISYGWQYFSVPTNGKVGGGCYVASLDSSLYFVL